MRSAGRSRPNRTSRRRHRRRDIIAKDVRTVANVEGSREAFLSVLEKFEEGKVRITTVRDLFRDHMSTVADARGESLGAVASQ